MMKQDSLFFPCFPLNTTLMSDPTTLFDEPYPDMDSGHILTWLEDSMPQLPLILDDLYGSTDISIDNWWGPDLFDANTISISNSEDNLNSTFSSTIVSPPINSVISFYDQPQEKVLESDVSKKRKAQEDRTLAPQAKRSVGNKKGTSKSIKDKNIISGNNKDGRWAEQLLNPCAIAIANGNVTRVQHLLFVLQELASPTGDANYRLASHGMQALLRHLSSATNKPAKEVGPTMTFATSTPKFFQRSLINFNDINPWFTIPNNIANNAILQILSEQDHINASCNKTLHILDIGISHGFQWPTLLEALSRRPGGPPPLVRLTVVPPTPDNNQIPFANCPTGYDFASNILRYANDVNVNLKINKLDNCPLQNLDAQIIDSCPDETLIVCAQFRLHNLNHNKPNTRTQFLTQLRSMKPKGVILSDNNMDCSCQYCNKFDARFSQSLDHLWSFLDSTSIAFKGRDMEERKLLEGEAAKVLINTCEMNEKQEKWGERMNSVGFVDNAFSDDVVDQARALLKKYDSHWEMRVGEKDGSVGLWWKGQPVSFSSLWK
ncbi:protein NODULATION SIGNALING PATHWAY 1-like [Rutidosis leptorrhynchoides]|uniref:protein NODULATION SIGNALING PATHWAY 1-like n=1 Tax=Rutidosis leptorrhynchoides TaxID=125765 RepID=UPI003A997B60